MSQKDFQPCFKVINLEEENDTELSHSFKNLEKSLFQKYGITWDPIHSKTPFCKHDLGCCENVLTDSFKSFIYAYLIRGAVSLITLGLRILRKNLKLTKATILECFLSKESFKFGAFLGLMSLTLKALICIMRRIRKKEDWKNLFIPGMIAGYLNLFFVHKSHRVAFATFFLSRAFDACYNSLVNRKIIKKSQLNYVIIFMVLNGLTVYGRMHEPYIVPPSLARFYEFVFARNPLEKEYERVLPAITSKRLIKQSLGL